eukprot:scaffold16159_cov121-Cylindrotheca_fusiformis.AAC.1
MANACCLTKPGRHLRQLFLPAPRTAAYSHLVDDQKDAEMSYRRGSELATHHGAISDSNTNNNGAEESIPRKKHDEAMREISAVQYTRTAHASQRHCEPT